MANIALNNIYNYYLTTYAKNLPGSYDTHKKSELRNVYNTIIKQNKESPLFIIDDSPETKSFAVGLKEDACALKNTISSLGGLKEDELLNKKVAYSSNTNMASVQLNNYISSDIGLQSFEIQIDHLASPQVNIGKFLSGASKTSLVPDTYSFDLKVNDYSYEFQFHIEKDDTNKNILERLNRLINNAGIGISSDVLEDNEGNVALKIESNSTGLRENAPYLFRISDTHTSKRSGIVNYLGIGEITRKATNALFHINGVAHTASSNQFMVENQYTVTLHNIGSTEDETVTIGIKNDIESLTENVETLVNGYNNFLQSAIAYSEKHQKSNYLIKDMKLITANYLDEFTHYGLTQKQDGTLSMDRTAFSHAAINGDTQELLNTIRNFTTSTLNKANNVSLNPMNYVNRTIVAYKNPNGPNFASPYITSAYSGMLFNNYC